MLSGLGYFPLRLCHPLSHPDTYRSNSKACRKKPGSCASQISTPSTVAWSAWTNAQQRHSDRLPDQFIKTVIKNNSIVAVKAVFWQMPCKHLAPLCCWCLPKPCEAALYFHFTYEETEAQRAYTSQEWWVGIQRKYCGSTAHTLVLCPTASFRRPHAFLNQTGCSFLTTPW